MSNTNEGKFGIVAPLWVAVDRRALGFVPGTGAQVIEDAHGIQAGVHDGLPFVIFFTDQHLAQDFVEWKDKLNLRAHPLDSTSTLALILKDLQTYGYKQAGFDIGVNGKPVRAAFICDILASIDGKYREDASDET